MSDVGNRPDAGGPETGSLSSFVTQRPVAITMVFVAAVVFGYFSYPNAMQQVTGI